ncbi:MAG TPA: copper chaperone PCu(A)C [Casimicrobiaceae bacterium]|nr:copper chaperone PCu(A)C [Casimicrobiaceae bacterium]
MSAAGDIVLTPYRYVRIAGSIALAAMALASSLDARAVAVITVYDPWVRVAPNGKSAEAFMEIMSSEGATIVRVETAVSAEVPMQRPGTKRAVTKSIALPPRTNVKLAPNEYRLLLPKLNRPLKLGDRVALNLIVEAPDGTRQTIPVNAEVRRRSAYNDHMHPLQPHAHTH